MGESGSMDGSVTKSCPSSEYKEGEVSAILCRA